MPRAATDAGVTRRLVRDLAVVTGVDRASIWRRQGSQLACETLYDASARAFTDGSTIERHECPGVFDALGREIAAADAARTDPTRELATCYLTPAGMRGFASTPIRDAGEPIGAGWLETARETDLATPAIQRLTRLTAGILALRWRAMVAGRVGTVSTDPVFVSGMTVAESVTLAPRFHGHADDATIFRDAARLARTFGLPGLPMAAPAALYRTDLVRADCVRALLGAPDVLLIDERRAAFPGEIVTALINAARSVRMRGGAVLWMTVVPARQGDTWFPATQALHLRGGRIQPAEPQPMTEVP